MPKRVLKEITAFALSVLTAGCAGSTAAEKTIPYRYASMEEGKEIFLANTAYFDGYSQNDLDFKMQKKDAVLDEYKAFGAEQVQEFSEEEKKVMDEYFSYMEKVLKDNGYTLPPQDEIVLIKTTMDEEPGAAAYTHGTEIYISSGMFKYLSMEPEEADGELKHLVFHELFHCLTRSNPDFRRDMYSLIHFTVQDEDFPIPPGVFEYHISNPDVEHHNAYATFRIDGKDIDCFTDFVTTRHFEKEGDSFFETGTTALIPVDGTDTYYTPAQAENFDEIFGKNTDYVIDPEECMADNFALTMNYGMEGPEGKGYPNPEIIEGILNYLSGK